MIDWIRLATNVLWIVGCGLGLATLSYANWEAKMRGGDLRRVLGRRAMQGLLNVAAVLFCLGWMASISEPWERMLWATLTVAFGAQGWVSWRDNRRM